MNITSNIRRRKNKHLFRITEGNASDSTDIHTKREIHIDTIYYLIHSHKDYCDNEITVILSTKVTQEGIKLTSNEHGGQ